MQQQPTTKQEWLATQLNNMCRDLKNDISRATVSRDDLNDRLGHYNRYITRQREKLFYLEQRMIELGVEIDYEQSD